uniref:Uncharacterized protein n=1 Tax=Plectus sambesii TaxID=2011161 RepID=A0A914V2Y7_9BILA
MLLMSSMDMSGRMKKLKNMIFKKKKHRSPHLDASEQLLPFSSAEKQQADPAPQPPCRAAPSTTKSNISNVRMPAAQSIAADDSVATSSVYDDQSLRENETDDRYRPSEPIDEQEDSELQGNEIEKDGENNVGDEQEEREEREFFSAPVNHRQSTNAIDNYRSSKMRALEVIGTAMVDRLVEHRYNRMMLKEEQNRHICRIQPNNAIHHFSRNMCDAYQRTYDDCDVEHLPTRSYAPSSVNRLREDDSFCPTTASKDDDIETESSMEVSSRKTNDNRNKEESPRTSKQHSTKEWPVSKEERPKKEERTSVAQTRQKKPVAQPKEALSKETTPVENTTTTSKKLKQPTPLITTPKETSQNHQNTIPNPSSKGNSKQTPIQQASKTEGITRAPPSAKGSMRENKPKPVQSSMVKKSPKPIMKMQKKAPSAEAKATTSTQDGGTKVNRVASKMSNKVSRPRVPAARDTHTRNGTSEPPKTTKRTSLGVGDPKGRRGGEKGRSNPAGNRR